MNRYYTYVHIHPLTNEVLYVGMGQKDRAWAITSKARQSDHREYLEDLISQGFIASDWVTIVDRNLPKQEAYDKEWVLISEFKPKFNKDKGQRRMSLNDITIASSLREAGLSWSAIGRELGFHYTTIKHRCPC